MNGLRVTSYLICLALFVMLVGGLVTQQAAFALSEATVDLRTLPPGQEAQANEEEEIELNCKYPKLSSYAGSYFAFDIELNYKGGEDSRLFDIQVDVPTGFIYSIGRGYGEGTEIAAVRLDPEKSYGETIKVTVRSYVWLVPEPGTYPVTVEVSSGDLKNSIDLEATVTANYDLELETTTGRLNAEATAGKDNYSTIVIINTGTADLDNVIFESKIKGRPSGWSLTFTPEKIDSLSVGSSREIEVNIKPARKTISGDYMVTISAEPEAKNAFGSLDVRVTVLTATIWGWAGVGIVVLVIAGLAWMFVRLGRR